MRLLLDANLSPRLADLLTQAGLDVAHVRDHGLQRADDEAIFDFAAEGGFVLVSEDTDFGELLARRRTRSPSFVLVRSAEPLEPEEQAALLADNLPGLADDLAAGAVAVLGRNRIRIRSLPL